MYNSNCSKPQAGFTLAEIVVVGILVGILAAVAVPYYLGYVEKAAHDSAKSTCEVIAAAVTFTHNRGLDIAGCSEENCADTLWKQIGISRPYDKNWWYSFDGVSRNDPINATYEILAHGKGHYLGKTGYFFPRPAVNTPQWEMK